MSCILLIAVLTAVGATTILVETMNREYKLAGIEEGFVPNTLISFSTLTVIFWVAILASPIILLTAIVPSAASAVKSEISRSIRKSIQ